MSEKKVEEFNLAEKSFEITPAKQPMQATLALNAVLLLCAITFVLCILLSVAPLSRLPDPVIQLQTPFGVQLAQVGAWLPNNLGLIANHQDSQASTDYVEFLVLITLAFVIYVLCILFVLRQTPQGVNNKQYHQTLRLIWLATITAGLIYVFTPAMLSHDIFVYASYSRMMTTYHSNPYFAPLSAFPHDPLYHLNVWANATAAYGPVWLVICSLWGFILGPQPLAYVLSFRLFALVLHLLNTWLVTIILRANRQTSREVILGTLLYAWNPLVLLESSLGGHNDVFMVTFILLGILLSIHAEMKNQLTAPRGYLLPIIAFTLAALVKFTTLPLIVLFIILLIYRVLRPANLAFLSVREIFSRRWKLALLTVMSAFIISAIVAFAF